MNVDNVRRVSAGLAAFLRGRSGDEADLRVVVGRDAACAAVERGGANFAKTSTGFHPAGGATVESVVAMAAALDGRIGIKAAGGIGDAAFAAALVEASATRLGMSRTAEVLAEID